ncbi:MAG: XkdF-like putative serine protease domain-containing protein [Ilumatobacteraceae bacterium]
MVAVPSYISANASRGLDLLEHAGDGLRPATVREARAMAGGNVSEDKVTRMAAWFARHRGDLDSPKAGEYLRGETDRPTPGQVAWLLWGGSLGQDRMAAMEWAERTRDRLEKAVSARVREGLQRKVDDHNEEHGGTASKRVTLAMLTAVFERGVGAYNTNPESVRPGVGSSDQWAYARVNTFLQAVRTGRFPGGKFDTDLLPEGHPLSTRKDMDTEKAHIRYPDGEPIPHALPEAYAPAEGAQRCDNCKYYKIGACLKWGAAVRAGYWCKAWKPLLAEVDVELTHHDDEEMFSYGFKGDEEKGYGYEFRKEIVEEDGRFCVYSEGRGRRFGCYDTMADAEERLAQIESFARSLDGLTPEQLIAAHQLTQKSSGDMMLELARSVIEDRLEFLGFAPPYTTGDTTEKLAALHAVVPFAKAEERYTLGPVYVPGRLDGHGEFIDADTLQKAIWDWVRSGDRTIFLQHSEKAAGEMVEILTWPMPIQTALSLPGEEIRKVEFPAETPFMGVVWESWAWDLVKAGQLRGYSIGGKARRVEADLSLTPASE